MSKQINQHYDFGGIAEIQRPLIGESVPGVKREIGYGSDRIQYHNGKGVQDLATIGDIAALYYESDKRPDFTLPAWRFWHETTLSGTDRTSRLYYRVVGANDAILMHEVTYSILVTSDDAIEDPIGSGNFTVTLHEGTAIRYSSARTTSIDQITFKAGVYTGIELTYLDSSGGSIRTGLRVETIQPADTVKGLGRIDAPGNAVSVRIQLTKADRTSIQYTYPLV